MQEATQDSIHVSPRQEQLWLAEPDGPSDRIQAVVTIDGPLDLTRLEAALGRVVERHEILRTTFVRRPGIRVPLQVVNPELSPSWRTLDLRRTEASALDARLYESLKAELGKPIDFAQGPLVRALLVALDEDRHQLALTLSGLAADASSIAPLLTEIVAHYDGEGELELVEEPIQYADFSAWQHELISARDAADARTAHHFWAGLDGLAAPALPFAMPSSSPFVAEEVAVKLDADTVSALSSHAADYGASTATIVEAAWHALLGRVGGVDNVAIAHVGAARAHADLAGAIGAFVRPLPIHTDLAAEQPFADLVRAVARAINEVAQWQDYAPEAASRLTVGFLWNEPFRANADTLRFSLERLVVSDSVVRLRLSGEDLGDGARLALEYDPESFERESVQRLAGQLVQVLQSASATPGATIGELELLDETERARVLVDFNASTGAVPDASVHELIAARAVAAPERTAVIDESSRLSYAELDAQANQLAHRLRRAGVGPDTVVGLATDRSVDMVVGLLGILKSGGAYLPLHYEHPPARLAHQLQSSGARAVVTQSDVLEHHLPEFDGELICLDNDADRSALQAEPSTAPDVTVTPANLVYVIYTSGSTGSPKGVAVTHGNLINYVSDITRRLGADSEPLSFGVVSAISTDLGNTSVFGALCSGGTLVLVTPAVAADPVSFARQLERTPVDVIKITPSHIGALLAGNDPRALPRRTLVLGGERAPWDLVSRVQGLSQCAIINHYGPTEATVGCCTLAVTDGPGRYEPATVPIGRPISNTTCYVLDDRGRPVPIGVSGRLFVGGAGVAQGYLGQPELTAERFVADPFTTSAGARMYDTGDLARWLPDGTLEFLGRTDEQLKIRGYRVEPAEVESALRSHPEVQDAVVVARANPAGGLRLVAYCAVGGAVSSEELQRHIVDWLPEYMLPTAIVTLDSLPRTLSGKVDKLALPEPAAASPGSGEFVAPRTPVEQTVAKMWSQALGVELIGAHDDFFALGGHSLLATQVVAQVRSEFAVELPLSSLFTCPTIETLAAEIVGLMGNYDDDTDRLLAELEGLSDEEASRLLAGEETREA
jgi:amino acid adenylation domain-containing protein